MEILRRHENDTLVLALTGRLDATWADPVSAALDVAVRAGEHRIIMDLAGVDYISSAGLRVVIAGYKQLRAIQGVFLVRSAQPGVAKVIDLSGLGALLAAPATSTAGSSVGVGFETESARWERYGEPAAVRLRAIGAGSAFDVSGGESVEFATARFGLGIGALAATREEALPRLGELLAVSGSAAHLPADGSNRPDFLLAEQSLVPTAWLSSGLVVEGEPRRLLRFEAGSDARGVPLSEVATAALEAAGASAAAVVVATEAAGLIGASLRQAPGTENADPFAFPGVRDRLNFTSERAFRGTTCALVGVIATPSSPWTPWLRPLDRDSRIFGHVHAAVFSYRPIRKGDIALDETLRGFFEVGGLQSLLHLLNDTREPEGAGESEFHRGACWVAPISNEP